MTTLMGRLKHRIAIERAKTASIQNRSYDVLGRTWGEVTQIAPKRTIATVQTNVGVITRITFRLREDLKAGMFLTWVRHGKPSIRHKILATLNDYKRRETIADCEEIETE